MNIREHSNQVFTRQGGGGGVGTRNNPFSSVFNNKPHLFPQQVHQAQYEVSTKASAA